MQAICGGTILGFPALVSSCFQSFFFFLCYLTRNGRVDPNKDRIATLNRWGWWLLPLTFARALNCGGRDWVGDWRYLIYPALAQQKQWLVYGNGSRFLSVVVSFLSPPPSCSSATALSHAMLCIKGGFIYFIFFRVYTSDVVVVVVAVAIGKENVYRALQRPKGPVSWTPTSAWFTLTSCSCQFFTFLFV